MLTANYTPPCTLTPHYPKTTHFHAKQLLLAQTKRNPTLKVHASSSSTYSPTGAKVVEYTPWLIVGLGNPGNKYYGTRHNVGFEMIDKIAQREGIVMNTIQSKSLIGIGSIGEVPVLLAKPQAYMNFSGESVGPLAAYYKVPLRHILLVYDDMSIPNGVLRLQPKGGHGHHNGYKAVLSKLLSGSFWKQSPDFSNRGKAAYIRLPQYPILDGIYMTLEKLRSVMAHLDGRKEFPRLCIGIGNPPGSMDMRAFLLQKFSATERKQIDAALEQGMDAVRTLVFTGFSDTITKFNLGQKYKYHRV